MAEIKVKQNEDKDKDEGNIEIDLDFKGNTFDLLNITLLAFSKFLAGLKGIDEGMIDIFTDHLNKQAKNQLKEKTKTKKNKGE